MFSAILSYLFGPAGHQTYRGLVIGPAGQQTYRAIAILSYLFGATPYRLEMISAILLGLALHLMDSYSFGAIPYGLLFLVSVIVCDGGGGWRYTRYSQEYCRVWRYNLRIYIWNAPSFWRWG